MHTCVGRQRTIVGVSSVLSLVWGLRMELKSSGLVAIVFVCSAISLHPQKSFNVFYIKFTIEYNK